MEEIAWEWQAMDGCMNKAPMVKESFGRNPTDRGKKGTKRHILVDGCGVALSVVVTGANRHNVSQLEAVLENKIAEPIMEAEPENLCADAGYAGEAPCEVKPAAGYNHMCALAVKNSEKSLKTLLSKYDGGALRPATLGSTGSAS